MNDIAPIPADLRAVAEQACATMKHRITKAEWQGRSVYIKKSVPPKASSWNKLQGIIAVVTNTPALLPTTSPGGVVGLRIEAWRIAEFRRAGLKAPEVLALTDNWIVLEDMGTMVEFKLQRDPALTPADITRIILHCARAVAEMQRAGLAHGRAKLNDLVYQPDGGIAFIDFEEDLDAASIPLPDMHAREIYLFLCSVARFERVVPGIVEEAYDEYLDVYSSKKVAKALKRIVGLASPFRYFVWPFHRKLKGDVGRAYIATGVLKRALT